MSSVSEPDEAAVEREIERLAAYLVPYICERTGLSHEVVEQVMESQESFWDDQPHVVGRMFILGWEIDDGG